jgi:hypothetical protein
MQIGSQVRESLSESGYIVVAHTPHDGEVILKDDGGKLELWFAHDDHAGYTVAIDGIGYEFIRTATPLDIQTCLPL